MISAKIVADSISPQGHRLTTMEIVFPRYILAELNTHRVLSKNSASSRAIPLPKMIKSVLENTFMPMAWQKHHSGMQGTEYLDGKKKTSLTAYIAIAIDTMNAITDHSSKEYLKQKAVLEEKMAIINTYLQDYQYQFRSLEEWWTLARDKAIEMASLLYVLDVTKQLANRLLEPFMYHKVLVSGTEFENFFKLRCPQYTIIDGDKEYKDISFKSKKELIKVYPDAENFTDLQWLEVNKGQADIHMMFLAEAIYDAMNESTPVELKEGEWHIPYDRKISQLDTIDLNLLALNKYGIDTENGKELAPEKLKERMLELSIKISIARCARLSYQTLGDNPVIDYKKDLQLYEVLSKSGHWSPFEHVAKAMTEDEYLSYGKTSWIDNPIELNMKVSEGWCRNFRGFIQQRALID